MVAEELPGFRDLRVFVERSEVAPLVFALVAASFSGSKTSLFLPWLCSCPPSPPVAIRSPLSMATKVTNPNKIATPRRRFLFGSTRTKRASSGEASPRKISGRRWKIVSPSRPPTANATMTESEEGSMLGGHSARRKSTGRSVPTVKSSLNKQEGT